MNNILTVMEKRGFSLVDVDIHYNNFIFINQDKGIVCKVYSGKRWSLTYTNIHMLGVLTTGQMEDVFDDKYFEDNLERFERTAQPLKDMANDWDKMYGNKLDEGYQE